MFEKFNTNKYDDKIILLNKNQNITFGELKEFIAYRIIKFNQLSQKKCIITSKDHFEFILNFIAAVFSDKEIFLLNEDDDFNKMQDYFIAPILGQKKCIDNFIFPNIEVKNVFINIFTSGSSGHSKKVVKSLYNLIVEANDVSQLFLKNNMKLRFISTTNLNHLFGLTFHFMLPFINGFVIDTQTVIYPEQINVKNTFLVTSPSFLSKLEKYKSFFAVSPKYIVVAGTKCEDNIFEFFQQKSKMIEIYGSTESGVVAYRQNNFEDFLTVFPNVKISQDNDKNLVVQSDYSYENQVTLSDMVEINLPNKIKTLGRNDRILKIQEKKVSPQKIENQLKLSEFVKDAYCLKVSSKLGAAVVLTEEGQSVYLQQGQLKLIKKLKAELRGKFEIIPQKWRFFPEIYKTQTGKINKEKIECIFYTNISFPLILEQKFAVNKADFELVFPTHSNFFKGHFTDFPIVPGVVELFVILFLSGIAFNTSMVPQTVKKIKFSHIILPNQKVKISMIDGDNSVEFTIFTDEYICASGILMKTELFELK